MYANRQPNTKNMFCEYLNTKFETAKDLFCVTFTLYVITMAESFLELSAKKKNYMLELLYTYSKKTQSDI